LEFSYIPSSPNPFSPGRRGVIVPLPGEMPIVIGKGEGQEILSILDLLFLT